MKNIAISFSRDQFRNSVYKINKIEFPKNTKPEEIFDFAYSLIPNTANYKIGVIIGDVICYLYKGSEFKSWCEHFKQMI